MPKYKIISGPYFPAFGLNTGKYGPEITPYLTETYRVNPRIQPKYRKILARNNSVFGHFSRSVVISTNGSGIYDANLQFWLNFKLSALHKK